LAREPYIITNVHVLTRVERFEVVVQFELESDLKPDAASDTQPKICAARNIGMAQDNPAVVKFQALHGWVPKCS
jgi:hypothetical protein